MRRPEPNSVPPEAVRDLRRKRRPGACFRVRMHQARRHRRRAGQRAEGPWIFLALAAAVLGDALTRILLGLPRQAMERSRAVPANGATMTTPDVRARGAGEPATPVQPSPADTGIARFERARTDYLPPLSVGDAALARALDYLIRNGGGRHGPATEARWLTVDAASLPLGVYLRSVDDRSAWRSLQREVGACLITGARPVLREDRNLDREKLHKLATMARVWATRGSLLMLDGPDGDDPSPTPELIPEGDVDPVGGPRRR